MLSEEAELKQEESFLYQDMTVLKITEIEQTTVNIVWVSGQGTTEL